MATHTEEVKIKFSAETNTQSFQQLQRELDKIQDTYRAHANPQKNLLADEFKEAAAQAEKLSSAMTAAYNPRLNTYNIDTLNQKLKQSGTNLKDVLNSFNKMGGQGSSAIISTLDNLTSFNFQLNTTKTIVDKIGEGLLKTFSWSVYSSVINNISSGIQQAYGYVKALDSSLNDIRIVTGKSADEMTRFAEIANKSAITLGKGTKDYTDAALIYYQQGLADSEVQARTEATLKTASVTQQDTAAVSEQLTAIWNGYKVSAEEAELYVDKVAAVAATTAADLEELSTGMSKVASAANLLGVDVDQMNAMLATTVSVTRQSAESVGVAYKTIFARMSSIQAGETAEDGATLTSYTEKMANLGFNVLDANNKLRDMGEVVEEIGDKWQTLSREQQIALAQVMAGTRQYNNLTALFDNWDMYKNALQTSADAAGTLNKQQEIFMDSTQAHLQQLSTAAEGVYDSLLDAGTINDFVDGLTKALEVTEKIVNGFGGLKGILSTIAPIVTNIFSKQIGKTLVDSFSNLSVGSKNQAMLNAAFDRTQSVISQSEGLSNNAQVQEFLNLRSDAANIARGLSTESANEIVQMVQQQSSVMKELGQVYDVINGKSEELVKELKAQGYAFDEAALKDKSYYEVLKESEESLSKQTEQITELNEALDLNNLDLSSISFRVIDNIGEKSDSALKTFISNYKEQFIQAFFNGEDLGSVIKDNIDKLPKGVRSNIKGAASQIAETMQKELMQAFHPLTKMETDGLSENVAKAFSDIQSKIVEIEKTVDPEEKKAKIKELQEAIENFGKITKDVATETVENVKAEVEKSGEVISAEEDRVERFHQAFKEALNDGSVEKLVTGFTKLASATMSVVSVFESISNAIKVLNDDSASLGDKISAVMRVMLSLGSAFATIKAAIKGLQEAQAKETIGKVLNTAAAYLNEKATRKAAAAKQEETLKTEQNTKAKNKNTVANVANSASEETQTATGFFNPAASGLGGKLASTKLGTALGLTSGGAALMVGLGAALVAIAATIATIVLSMKAWNKANEELEKANERFDELSQKAQEAKEKLNSFKDSTSSLQSLQDELSKLGKGTEEWNEKLQEIQSTTANLIEQFPELRKYATWEDGGWTIAAEDLKAFQEELEKTQESSVLAEQTGYINKLEAEREVNATNARHNDNKWEYWSGTGIGYQVMGVDDNNLAAEQRYIDTLKDEKTIQENINKAKQEQNSKDIKYWENILAYKNKTLEIEKAQQQLAQMIVDQTTGEEIHSLFTNRKGEQTREQQFQEEYFNRRLTEQTQRDINRFTAHYSDSQNRKELHETLKRRYAALYQVGVDDVEIGDFANSGQLTVKIKSKDVEVKLSEGAAAQEGGETRAREEAQERDYKQYYQGLVSGKSFYQIMAENARDGVFDIEKYTREELTTFFNDESLYTGIEEQVQNIQNSYEEALQGLREGISTKSGKSLLEAMLGDDSAKDLTLEDWSEIALAIQEVYEKEGPEALETFREYLRDNKVEVKDFMDFNFDDTTLYNFSEDVQKRLEDLKIDEKTLKRYQRKLGLKGENLYDDEVANTIINYIAAEDDLNKIYKDREAIFDTLRSGYSADGFIDNLADVSDAINTYFGTNVDDDLILSHLKEIEDFVNGVGGSAETLRKILKGGSSTESSNESAIEVIKSELSQGDTIDENAVSRIKDSLKELGYGEESFNSIMETLGFEEKDGTYIKKVPIGIEPQPYAYNIATIDYTEGELRERFSAEGPSRWVKTEGDKWVQWLDLSQPEFIKLMEEKGFTAVEDGENLRFQKIFQAEITPEIVANNEKGQVIKFKNDTPDNTIAQSLGFNTVEEAKADGWTITRTSAGPVYVAKAREQIDVETVINNLDNGIYVNFSAKADDKTVAEALGYSTIEDAKAAGWDILHSPGGVHCHLKVERDVDVVDSAVDYKPNVTDDAKKPDPWETQKSDYNYSDQIINSKKKELEDLQEEAEYLSGDALLENYEKQKKVLEEINQELEKRNEKLREENTETQGDLEKLAEKYGVKLAYDESGRVTQESYEAVYNAMNKAGEAATTTEAQNKIKADMSAFASGVSKINSNVAEMKDNTESVNDNLDEIKQLDITEQFTDSNQAITKATRNTDLWKNQIKELSEDFDSLSPEEQIEKLEAQQKLKKNIVEGAREGLVEVKDDINKWIGDNNIKLPGIDFSNLENMSPTELQELQNKVHEALESKDLSPEQKKQLEPILEYLEKAEPLVQDIEDYTEKTVSHTKEIKEATNQMRLDEIEQETSKINKELEKIKEAQSDLSGAALIANLQKQQSLQRQLLEQEKKKSAELLRQRQAQENTLRNLEGFKQLGVEIQYNTDGTLANYYEIQKAIYENADLNEAVKKILLEQLDILNSQAKAYGQQNEAVEKSKKAVKDLAKEIKKQILETALKDFNAKIDVELNIEDAWRNLHKLRTELEGLKKNDYLKNVNMQLKQLQEYLRTNPNSTLAGGSIQMLSDHVSKIMSEIRKMQSGAASNLYGKDQAQAFQDLQKYRDELGSTVDNALQSIEEVRQTYLSAIDDMISSNNKYMSSWDKINEILQNAADVMSLTYGDKAYDRMKKYLEEEQKNNLELANTARSLANAYEQRYREATSDEERMKYADAWQEAMSKVFSYQKAAIENAQKLFDEAMKNMKSLGDDIWSTIFDSSAIPIGMRWDLEKEKAKDYLDYTQSVYERDALQRKLAESISNAETVSAANKLREIQTEILDRLNSQIDATKTLTQFEVDRANALYELTLRQIALEEARDNKTKMRLRRDKAGNYRYEYVADDNDIADKQQAVDDAMMDLYNMTKDAGIETSDYLRSLREEFYNKVEELYKDDALEPEQISAAIAELTDTYNQKWNERVQELYKIYNDLLGLSKGENEGFEGTLRDILHLTDIERGMFTTPLEEIQQKFKELRDISTTTADATAEQTPADVEFATDIKDWEIEQARQMALQVDSIANLLPYLESMADDIKGLSATALQIYEQALLLREQLGKDNSGSSKNISDGGSIGDGTFYYTKGGDGRLYIDPEYRRLLQEAGITTIEGRDIWNPESSGTVWASKLYHPEDGDTRRHYTIEEALRLGKATQDDTSIDGDTKGKTLVEKLFETAMNAKLWEDIYNWAKERNIELDKEKLGKDKEYTQQVKEQYEKWRDEEQEVNMTFNLPNVTNYTEVLKALMEFGSKGLYVAQQKKKKASSVTK